MIILFKGIFGKKAFPIRPIQLKSGIIQKAFHKFLTGEVVVLFRNIYSFEYVISGISCPLGNLSIFQRSFNH